LKPLSGIEVVTGHCHSPVYQTVKTVWKTFLTGRGDAIVQSNRRKREETAQGDSKKENGKTTTGRGCKRG